MRQGHRRNGGSVMKGYRVIEGPREVAWAPSYEGALTALRTISAEEPRGEHMLEAVRERDGAVLAWVRPDGWLGMIQRGAA